MSGLPACLDASFLLRMLLDEVTGSRADALWEAWHREGRRLVAPALLYYEVTNALHRYVARGELSLADAEALLDVALRLDIELFADADLCRRALRLANTLSLPAAYDAHYLALAERLGGELWTADRRLAQAVQDRLPWVQVLGEQ